MGKISENISASQLQILRKEVHALDLKNGDNKTKLPFFSIRKCDQPTGQEHGVLDPSVCLIIGGEKKLAISRQAIDCKEGDFIASAINMPISGNISFASAKKPYIALRLTFEPREIFSIVKEADLKFSSTSYPGAIIRPASENLANLFLRLVVQAGSESSSAFVASLIKKEIIFELLSGEYGHSFLQASLFAKKDRGIGKALSWIKENFDRSIAVEQIAEESGMSVSALFSKFKSVTSMSPLQYQKQLRLQEARRILMLGLLDVTRTAGEVGYASPNQFNRDYKRYFGNSPLRDIKQM